MASRSSSLDIMTLSSKEANLRRRQRLMKRNRRRTADATAASATAAAAASSKRRRSDPGEMTINTTITTAAVGTGSTPRLRVRTPRVRTRTRAARVSRSRARTTRRFTRNSFRTTLEDEDEDDDEDDDDDDEDMSESEVFSELPSPAKRARKLAPLSTTTTTTTTATTRTRATTGAAASTRTTTATRRRRTTTPRVHGLVQRVEGTPPTEPWDLPGESLGVLQDWMAPVSLTEFLTQTFRQQALHVSHGHDTTTTPPHLKTLVDQHLHKLDILHLLQETSSERIFVWLLSPPPPLRSRSSRRAQGQARASTLLAGDDDDGGGPKATTASSTTTRMSFRRMTTRNDLPPLFRAKRSSVAKRPIEEDDDDDVAEQDKRKQPAVEKIHTGNPKTRLSLASSSSSSSSLRQTRSSTKRVPKIRDERLAPSRRRNKDDGEVEEEADDYDDEEEVEGDDKQKKDNGNDEDKKKKKKKKAKEDSQSRSHSRVQKTTAQKSGPSLIQSIEVDNAETAWSLHQTCGHALYFRAPPTAEQALVQGLFHSLGMLPHVGETRGEVELFVGAPGHVTQWHYDFQENFTIQLSGTKRWTLKRGSVCHPLRACTPHYQCPEAVESQLKSARLSVPGFEFGPPRGDEEEEEEVVVMKPGDVLYVPAGMWHCVETMPQQEEDGGCCISMNVSLMACNYASLVCQALQHFLLRDDAWRQQVVVPHHHDDKTKNPMPYLMQLDLPRKIKEFVSFGTDAILPPVMWYPTQTMPKEDNDKEEEDNEGHEKEEKEEEEEEEEEGEENDADNDEDNVVWIKDFVGPSNWNPRGAAAGKPGTTLCKNPLATLLSPSDLWGYYTPPSSSSSFREYILHVNFAGNEAQDSMLRIRLRESVDANGSSILEACSRREKAGQNPAQVFVGNNNNNNPSSHAQQTQLCLEYYGYLVWKQQE